MPGISFAKSSVFYPVQKKRHSIPACEGAVSLDIYYSASAVLFLTYILGSSSTSCSGIPSIQSDAWHMPSMPSSSSFIFLGIFTVHVHAPVDAQGPESWLLILRYRNL